MKRMSSNKPRSLRDHATERVQVGVISALAICIVAFGLLGSVAFKPAVLPDGGAEIRPVRWDEIPIERMSPPPPAKKLGEIVEATDGDTSASIPDISLLDTFAIIPGQGKLELTLDSIGFTPVGGTYPEVIGNLDIPYPDNLRSRGIEGTVVVLVGLNEQGAIFDARIYKGSGYGALDSLVLRNIWSTRFTPALQNGKPIPVKARIPIEFKVDR